MATGHSDGQANFFGRRKKWQSRRYIFWSWFCVYFCARFAPPFLVVDVSIFTFSAPAAPAFHFWRLRRLLLHFCGACGTLQFKKYVARIAGWLLFTMETRILTQVAIQTVRETFFGRRQKWPFRRYIFGLGFVCIFVHVLRQHFWSLGHQFSLSQRLRRRL